MSYTTFAHIPPRGEYRCTEYSGYRFFSSGEGSTISFLSRGNNSMWPPHEFDTVSLNWIMRRGLERVGEYPE